MHHSASEEGSMTCWRDAEVGTWPEAAIASVREQARQGECSSTLALIVRGDGAPKLDHFLR